jgi:hypothetical protein
MAAICRAERAISPATESVSWVVIDDNFVLHTEANAYLGGLRARDCSINTERRSRASQPDRGGQFSPSRTVCRLTVGEHPIGVDSGGAQRGQLCAQVLADGADSCVPEDCRHSVTVSLPPTAGI